MTFLDYARRGRTAWWLYLVTGVFGPLLGIFGSAALAAIAQTRHLITAAQAAGTIEGSDPLALLWITGVTFAIVLVVFAAVVWAVQQKTPLDIIGAWSWRLFSLGIVIWGMTALVTTLVDFALSPGGFQFTGSKATIGLALVALLTLPVQTFAEEFFFRGYLTQGLLLWLKRPIPVAIISGVLFGSAHIPNGYPQAISAAVLGVVFALIAIRTGGIAMTFGMHLVNNLFGAFVVVSTDDVFKGLPALITQSTPWFTWSDVCLEIIALGVVGWFVLTRMPIRESAAPETVGA